MTIARLLAMNPDIMLFDKITAEGMTCMLVTREIADHIYFTDRRIIVEHGPPASFFTEARDPRTREFLSQIL